MRDPKKITEKVAEAFIENPENFELSEADSITDEAAEILAEYEHRLYLDGLASLSDIAAKTLACHTGGCSLSGLASIADSTAQILGEFDYLSLDRSAKHLSLKGLQSLSKVRLLSLDFRVFKPEHAKVIASFDGQVWLGGFRKISDESARELSGFNGEMLSLGIEVRNLSKEAARSLCEISALLRFSGGENAVILYRLIEKADFDFDSEADRAPKHLDADFIKKWERGPSAYSLAHALTIDDEAAEALSAYGEKEWGGCDSVHQIDLSNLTELSEISADYLAKAVRGKWASGSHDWILLKGDLKARVSGITKFTIGEEIAKVWIQDNEMAGDKKGDSKRLVNLKNFNDISDKAALLLSKFDGPLSLGGLTEISDAAAEALSKHEGDYLILWGLTALSDAAAESLSKHKGKRLELRGLTSISDSAADSLSKVQGSLFLGRLTSLSDSAADSLSKVQGDLYIGSLGGLPSLRRKPLAEKILRKSWPNAFKELRDMSDEVAEAFAQGDEGCFDGLISLSDAAADALSKVEAPLSLRGLVSLSDNAAKSLAKHKEERLYLSGLTSLTDVAAKYLSTHEGGLCLDGLTELSDAAADHLSKHKGDIIFLDGLTSLSDTAAESLAAYGGSLYLNGLTDLSPTAAKHLLKSKTVTTKLNLKKIAKG